eukprot:COSAG04_NODE_456_length_14055_cov_41.823660_2_plen_86_part_00
MGRFDLALPLRTEALAGQRRLLGDRHPSTLLSVGNLGTVCCCIGDHLKAAELLEEAVAGFTELYGEGHQQTRHFKSVQERVFAEV